MKPLNFISPVPTSTHQHFKRWALFSCLLISTLALSILAYSLYARWSLGILRASTQHMQGRIAQYTALEHQHTALVTAHTQAQQLPELLRALAALLPGTCALRSVQYTKDRTVNLTGVAQTAQALHTFITELTSSTLYRGVTLTRTKQMDNGFTTFEVTFTLR